MRSFLVKSFIIVLAAFNFSPLSSWGLLQGRVDSAHGGEKSQFIAGLYKLYDPFYSGPLLAPSAHTVPYGYCNSQSYFFWKRTYGEYSRSWNRRRTRSSLQYQYLSIFQYGLTNFMDLNVIAQCFRNRNQDKYHFGYGDTNLATGIQLLEGIIGTALPSCVLQLSMNFPSGKYRHLDESNLGVDATGAGAYGVGASLNFQKDFNTLFRKDIDPSKYHPFRFRWSFAYTINSRTHVKGVNAYGGNRRTRGTVKVGNNFTSIFAWEFSFTKHWVLATDWQYTASAPSKFSGNTGGAPVGGPGNQNWSVAPALEFNLNEKFGALAGAWFSLTGRNSDAFVAGIFSFTWLF